jgi:enamine deaminase RidA (YjgF/YER057c/UK114 family)
MDDVFGVDTCDMNLPDHAPIWTEVEVASLGLSTMRIEIRVTAIVI